MLLNLHVKNLAIIDEIEVDFSEGMNVLTGETGAGKSIIIDSIGMAVGGRIPKDIIRKGADFALIELLFSVEGPEQKRRLDGCGIALEDDEALISRRIAKGRCVNRINGESVPTSVLRQAAAVLIDIHGQNEQQSLLRKSEHIRILDRYAGKDVNDAYARYKDAYARRKDLLAQKNEGGASPEERLREASFIRYELKEIEEAALVSGEEAALLEEHLKLSNASAIAEGLSEAYAMTAADGAGTASDMLGRASRIVSRLCEYDGVIGQFADRLSEIDALLSDFNRDVSAYMDGMDAGDNEDRLAKVQARLDLVRSIKAKYGATTALVLEYADGLRKKLKDIEEYEERKEKLDEMIKDADEQTEALAKTLTQLRKKSARALEGEILNALADLSFSQVRFSIEIGALPECGPDGADDVEFMISLNPGEDLKPMGMAASGGELSRIMLAIKAVLAKRDDVSALIFDEIDAGISGRTAQRVAEKMALIAKSRQVICISHLAQIAAMSDAHYLIEKESGGGRTSTSIRKLDKEGEIEELARMLGGAKITRSVMESAGEMKKLALNLKKSL